MKKILIVFGTRPEAIKCAPVVFALRRQLNAKVVVCVTGQHRQMLDQVLELFDLKADFDLNVMTANQDLAGMTATILTKVCAVIRDVNPDIVLVQGDTTTAMAASLAAFYNRVSIGHIEAGLRTGNLYSPWPEEANRKICDAITKWYFAPTAESRDNLLKEGIPSEKIHVTGNTVIDALHIVHDKLRVNSVLRESVAQSLPHWRADQKMILVTGHRRENFGEKFEQVCQALRDIAMSRPELHIVYPVHLNPNVQAPVQKILSGVANVSLIKPQDYLPFVHLMSQSHLIVTDSGGVQEEAPSLGKPVLVTRDTTERPEAIAAGTAKLIGSDYHTVRSGIEQLIDDEVTYQRMSRAHNPYGDGKASERIAHVLLRQETVVGHTIENATMKYLEKMV